MYSIDVMTTVMGYLGLQAVHTNALLLFLSVAINGMASRSINNNCYNHCSAVFVLCDQQSKSMRETFNCIRLEWNCRSECARRMLTNGKTDDQFGAARR